MTPTALQWCLDTDPFKTPGYLVSTRDPCSRRPSHWAHPSNDSAFLHPQGLTSLWQSRKVSLVRILQEESTTVCFMMLLWQVAGDTSRGTWERRGAHRKTHGQALHGLHSTQKEGGTRPASHPCHPLPTFQPRGQGDNSGSRPLGICTRRVPDVLFWCRHTVSSLSRSSQSPRGLPPLGGCCR